MGKPRSSAKKGKGKVPPQAPKAIRKPKAQRPWTEADAINEFTAACEQVFTNNEPGSAFFVCRFGVCLRRFENRPRLTSHHQRFHERKHQAARTQCQFILPNTNAKCSKSFAAPSYYYEHLKKVHGIKKENLDPYRVKRYTTKKDNVPKQLTFQAFIDHYDAGTLPNKKELKRIIDPVLARFRESPSAPSGQAGPSSSRVNVSVPLVDDADDDAYHSNENTPEKNKPAALKRQPKTKKCFAPRKVSSAKKCSVNKHAPPANVVRLRLQLKVCKSKLALRSKLVGKFRALEKNCDELNGLLDETTQKMQNLLLENANLDQRNSELAAQNQKLENDLAAEKEKIQELVGKLATPEPCNVPASGDVIHRDLLLKIRQNLMVDQEVAPDASIDDVLAFVSNQSRDGFKKIHELSRNVQRLEQERDKSNSELKVLRSWFETNTKGNDPKIKSYRDIKSMHVKDLNKMTELEKQVERYKTDIFYLLGLHSLPKRPPDVTRQLQDAIDAKFDPTESFVQIYVDNVFQLLGYHLAYSQNPISSFKENLRRIRDGLMAHDVEAQLILDEHHTAICAAKPKERDLTMRDVKGVEATPARDVHIGELGAACVKRLMGVYEKPPLDVRASKVPIVIDGANVSRSWDLSFRPKNSAPPACKLVIITNFLERVMSARIFPLALVVIRREMLDNLDADRDNRDAFDQLVKWTNDQECIVNMLITNRRTYDDFLILTLAYTMGGVIISRDRFVDCYDRRSEARQSDLRLTFNCFEEIAAKVDDRRYEFMYDPSIKTIRLPPDPDGRNIYDLIFSDDQHKRERVRKMQTTRSKSYILE